MVDSHISEGACQVFGALLFDRRTTQPSQSAAELLEAAEDFQATPGWLYAVERGEVRLTSEVARNLQEVYGAKLAPEEDLATLLIELDEQPLGQTSMYIQQRHNLDRTRTVADLDPESLGTGWGLQVGDLPIRDRQLVLVPLILGSAVVAASVATFVAAVSDLGLLGSIWKIAWPASALVALTFLFLHGLERAYSGWVASTRPARRKSDLETANDLRSTRGLTNESSVWFNPADIPYLRPDVRQSYKTVAIQADFAERLQAVFVVAALVNAALSIAAINHLGLVWPSAWLPAIASACFLLVSALGEAANRSARQVLAGLKFGLGYPG